MNSVSRPTQEIVVANPPPTPTALQMLPAPPPLLTIEDASDHKPQDQPSDSIANATPPPADDLDQTPSKDLPTEFTENNAHIP